MPASVASAPERTLPEHSTLAQRQITILVSLSCCVYFATLVYYATVRRVDGDEGFYTTSARLVWQGKTPYQDFFYQQAPLLPYIYSWIWAIRPNSLVAMRILSTVFCAATTLLWGLGLLRIKALPGKVVLATLLAILLDPYWISWNVVVKTFSFSNLMISVALVSLYAALQSGRTRWYFAAGLALGICASARSFYGPLIPAAFTWLLIRNRGRANGKHRTAMIFAAGAILGLSPLIFSFARDPQAFLFNNIRYHTLQAGYLPENGKIAVGYQDAGTAVLTYIGFIFVLLVGLHPYFTVQAVLASAGIVSVCRLRKRRNLSYTNHDYSYFELVALLLLVFAATSLIAFPPYDQYFVTPLVPFFIPFLAEVFRTTIAHRKNIIFVLAALAPVLFAYGLRREVWEYSRNPEWKVSSYHKVTAAVKFNSNPTDVVLSLFPGYVFESGRQYFPGLEDQFTFRIIDKITPDVAARYHIVSKEMILHAVAQGVAEVIVISRSSEYFNSLSAADVQNLQTTINSNYSMMSEIDSVEVYRRRSLPAALISPGEQ
jgi:Dolichyl-phosphate-mannose-protein mannosyltransferase